MARTSPPFPFRFWKLDPGQVYASGPNAWDTAVHDASEEYKHRMVGGGWAQGIRVPHPTPPYPDPAALVSPA